MIVDALCECLTACMRVLCTAASKEDAKKDAGKKKGGAMLKMLQACVRDGATYHP